LPFIVNRLETPVRAQVANIVLLGLSTTAEFEFHIADWLGQGGGPEYSTIPEVNRLTTPVTCVRGADEDESACELVTNPQSPRRPGAGHAAGRGRRRRTRLGPRAAAVGGWGYGWGRSGPGGRVRGARGRGPGAGRSRPGSRARGLGARGSGIAFADIQAVIARL